MIYVFEENELLNIDFVNRTSPLLSVQRREKIESYKIISDKINGCLAYLLLRYALKNEFGICDKPEFIFGKREKPFLKDFPNIFFNISHCKYSVVCSVSKRNTAVDAADFRTVRPSAVKRVCSESEREFLNKCNDIPRNFAKLWAMKECYSKFDGGGLSLDFKKITENLDICKKIKYLEREKYIIASICENPTPEKNKTPYIFLNKDFIYKIC